jgi:hypothetical protein
MRIEGQYSRLQTSFAGRADYLTQQFIVPGVDTVEVADGHRHRLKPGGFL